MPAAAWLSEMPLWQLTEEQKLELFTDGLDDLLIHSEAGTKAVKAPHRTDNEGQCERKYLQVAELGISGYPIIPGVREDCTEQNLQQLMDIY